MCRYTLVPRFAELDETTAYGVITELAKFSSVGWILHGAQGHRSVYRQQVKTFIHGRNLVPKSGTNSNARHRIFQIPGVAAALESEILL